MQEARGKVDEPWPGRRRHNRMRCRLRLSASPRGNFRHEVGATCIGVREPWSAAARTFAEYGESMRLM
jgi:hypothetical protein